MPGWKRHALHFFRDLRAESPTAQSMINAMRKRKGITILAEEVEVAS